MSVIIPIKSEFKAFNIAAIATAEFTVVLESAETPINPPNAAVTKTDNAKNTKKKI